MATSPNNVFDQFDTAKPSANPFDQFDAPTIARNPNISLSGFRDAGDLALAGLSNTLVAPTVSGIAGLGATLSGRDPVQARQAATDRFVYHTQPGSDARQIADQVSSGIGRVAAPIESAIESGYSGIGRMAGPRAEQEVRGAVGTLGDIAGIVPVVGAAARGVRLAGQARTARAAHAGVAKTPIEIAEAAGFRIAPSSVQDAGNVGNKPNIVARMTESVADPYKVSSDNIRHNKAIANDIAVRELGLKSGTPLSESTLTEASRPHAAVYNAVRNTVQPLPVTPDLSRAISMAGRGTDSVLPLPASIDAFKESLLARPMNGGQLLDTISDLRQKGWKGINAKDNPDANAVGNAQLDMANALEDHLERSTLHSNPGLADQYRKARIGFAKIETVKRAMVGNDIDPQALRKAAAKTNAIEGGLKVIADTAEFFPSDMKVVIPKRSEIGRAVHAAMAFGSLGTIPILQGGLAKVVGATRGESAVPKLGLGGPLGYEYRQSAPAFAGSRELNSAPYIQFHPSQNTHPRGLPSPSTVTPMHSGPFSEKDVGLRPSFQHPAGVKPFSSNQLSIDDSYPMRSVTTPVSPQNISLAEVLAGDLTMSDPLSPALQRMRVTPNTVPVSSTATVAQRKAITDHLVQVLARHKLKGGK